MPWTPPALSVKYGPYFKADVDDQVKLVGAVRQAFDGAKGTDSLIPREVAIKMLAPMFGIENVTAVIEALDKEAKEKSDRELERTTAEQASLHKLTKNDAPGSNPAGD